MPYVIVSYDGAREDGDALALGKLFALLGADVTLAYVRHAAEADPGREASEREKSERLLDDAARQLQGEVGRRVVLHPSTADGLSVLIAELGAQVIAFGSSYRTPVGEIEWPHTAEQLLDSEIPCSIALAPAGFQDTQVERDIETVGLHDEGDEAAQTTAYSLAEALGATLSYNGADLLVVASRPDAPSGRLILSSVAREQIAQARSPVIALARGAALRFNRR